MTAKLDYQWHLRQVMATRGMFSTTDLLEPLSERGIKLSSSQVYRLVVDRPERLSLKILMALLDILDCAMTTSLSPSPLPGRPRRRRSSAVRPESASSGPDGPDHPGRRVSGGRDSRGHQRPDRCHHRPDHRHRGRLGTQPGRGFGSGCRWWPGQAPQARPGPGRAARGPHRRPVTRTSRGGRPADRIGQSGCDDDLTADLRRVR